MALRSELAAIATITLWLVLPSDALAQIRFHGGFDAVVDCDRPIAVRNFTVHGDASGVLNADKTASADLMVRTLTASQIHFDGRLGRTLPAPGGSAQAIVVGRNHLRLIWNLPNNQFITNIVIAGKSCTASVDTKLRRGAREYSLFDGSSFYYCGRPRVVRTTCNVS
jgi:hypothetical protein